jgi:hypothetical protein
MRAVDTNVLVRFSARDDVRHDRSPAALATAVEMLLNHKDLTIQDADAVGAALDLFRSHPALGVSGCLLPEVARKARETRRRTKAVNWFKYHPSTPIRAVRRWLLLPALTLKLEILGVLASPFLLLGSLALLERVWRPGTARSRGQITSTRWSGQSSATLS